MNEQDNRPVIVDLDGISVDFPVKGGLPFSRKRKVRAVTDVSLSVREGETFGIVGESGCGKSTIANAMVGMVRPTAGRVTFLGKDLNALDRKAFRELRRNMQMIFQDPFSSLNPRFTVQAIVSEPLVVQGGLTEDEIRARVVETLALVGLSEEDLPRYPSDFSGGQRQRIGIARSIIMKPKFLVCDEPVSALDVSVHAQILNLLIDLQDKLGITYVFISHNLAVVKSICDRMVVMYLGKVMEAGSVEEIYESPRHPYTKALMSAILDVRPEEKRHRVILQGDIPSPIDPPAGCRFWQRCPFAMEGCKDVPPPVMSVGTDHTVACHLVSGFDDTARGAGLDRPVAKPGAAK
ncbi:MAG: oligopeptide/dipeptide ABC transporter ATP-binding protein [Candidatus Izemoplasmatales bacterium]